jgi:choline monooxygenase
MSDRLDFLPIEEYVFSPGRSRDYLVRANWALYVDNYLEGFHIPYVHPELAQALDTKEYTNEIFDYASLQIGVSSTSGEGFEDIPKDSIDAGRNIAAYYYFLFPNMMFNFYPWGLSINVVTPLAVDRTKVSFLSYVYDESKIGSGAGAALDKVEREDEDIVERVQRGMNSRFYDSGRYSPKHEAGVHHFHGLIREFLGID